MSYQSAQGGSKMLFNSPLLAPRACVRVRDSQLPLETLRSEGAPGAVCSHNKQHGDLGCLSSCQPVHLLISKQLRCQLLLLLYLF